MSYPILLALFTLPLIGGNIVAYQYKGVTVKHQDRNMTIEREIDPKCLYIPISNDTIWSGEYAGAEVPKPCQARFVTSVGQVQPIRIDPDVETFGELEVMAFLEKMQKNNDMMLIDTRSSEWFDYRTIPGAVNLPFFYLVDREQPHLPDPIA